MNSTARKMAAYLKRKRKNAKVSLQRNFFPLFVVNMVFQKIVRGDCHHLYPALIFHAPAQLQRKKTFQDIGSHIGMYLQGKAFVFLFNEDGGNMIFNFINQENAG